MFAIPGQQSLRKTVGKTLTDPGYARSDSNFERWNISLKGNKRDGVDSNSDGFDYCVRQNEGKILWFTAEGTGESYTRVP